MATKRQRSVLTEEDFVDCMGAIIQRDYFPDLPRIRAQLAYIEALEAGEPAAVAASEARLRALATPGSAGDATPARGGGAADGVALVAPPDAAADAPTLDRFLARFTSEDNASFAELHARQLAARRAQLWFMDQDEHARRTRLLGPNGEAVAHDAVAERALPPPHAGALTVEGDSRPSRLQFNAVGATNALFFFPPQHPQPRAQALMGPPPALAARCTRLPTTHPAHPASAPPVDSEPLARARAAGAAGGALGLVPSTPALTPGRAGESPMMTWGQVASTPLLLTPLDASPFAPAACDGGPSYRLPAQPRREAVSHSLLRAEPAAQPAARRAGSAARSPEALSGAGRQLAAALSRTGSALRPSLGFELRASYGGGATPRAHAPDGRRAAGATPRAQSRAPTADRLERPASAGAKRGAPSTPSRLAVAPAARAEHAAKTARRAGAASEPRALRADPAAAAGAVTDGLLKFAS